MREIFYAGNLLRYTLDKTKKKLLLYWKKNKDYGQYNFCSPYTFYFCLDLHSDSMAPTFIIHTESWINSVNYYRIGPILTEAKGTFITYYLILYISPPSPLSMQRLCFSHSSFPCSSSNIKPISLFMIPTPVVLCIPVFAFCILLLFLPPSQEWISYSTFLFPSPPHPVISPSNRKIQSHFRQHAPPSFLDVTKVADITLRVVPGWRRRGCNFLFDVWIRFIIHSTFYSRLFFIYEVVMKWKWVPISGLLCQESVVERTSLQELPMSSII